MDKIGYSYLGLLQAFVKKASSVRYYHTTTTLNKLKTNISDLNKQKAKNSIADSAIEEILKYRKTRFDIPLIKFTDKKIITCTNISDKFKRLAFIKELGSKCGIYRPSFYKVNRLTSLPFILISLVRGFKRGNLVFSDPFECSSFRRALA